MHGSASRFLVAVLGRTGASALGTLAKADPGLAGYLVPRAALAWLRHVGATVDLPGVAEAGVVLHKTEAGFDGAVVIDGTGYDLAKADAATVAVALSLSVGVTPALAPSLRDRDLAQLGNTIELLAKAQAKKPEVEGTGKAAAAIAPIAPAQPTPTAPDTSQHGRVKIPLRPAKPPGAPKPRTAPLALAEVPAHGKKCSVCDTSQFRAGKFVGCRCIRSMVKSMGVAPTATGVALTLDRLQPDQADLVLERLGGRDARK